MSLLALSLWLCGADPPLTLADAEFLVRNTPDVIAIKTQCLLLDGPKTFDRDVAVVGVYDRCRTTISRLVAPFYVDLTTGEVHKHAPKLAPVDSPRLKELRSDLLNNRTKKR